MFLSRIFRKKKDLSNEPVIEKVIVQNVAPRKNDIVEYNFFKKNKVRKYIINMYAKDVPVEEKDGKYKMVAKYNSDPQSIMYIYIACSRKEVFTKANLFISATVENNRVLDNNIIKVFPISQF